MGHLGTRLRPGSGTHLRARLRASAALSIHKVDGTDYFACRSLAAEATARVRAGEGPCLIHAMVTRPYSHSSQDTQSKYRSSDDLEEEATRDPILRLERELTEAGVLTAAEAAKIREDGPRSWLPRSRRRFSQARRPDPATVTDHVLALPAIPEPKLRRRPGLRRRRGRGRRQARGHGRGDKAGALRADALGRAHPGLRAGRRRRQRGHHRLSGRERAESSAPPTGSSASSGSRAATTPRSPRPTSSAAASARRYADFGRAPRSSSSTTSGPPCIRSARRQRR